MIGNYSARLTRSQRNLLALLATSVIFSAGCANMTTTAPASNPLSTAATLSGKIHGGNQPVIGATVTLWYAGQNGNPGFAPTLAATTTTDSTGSFSFVRDPIGDIVTPLPTGNTYSCPASTNPLVYVIAKGGNTQNNGNTSQTNSAAAFVAVYGDCYAINSSNFVYMSEVTTAATMAAMQQFFNPVTETFTADGTGQQKVVMDDLPKTIALLADLSTGLAVSSTVLGPATSSIANHNINVNPAVTVTATPETSKLNLIANITSACINAATSSAAPCTALFAAAMPAPAPNVTSFNSAMPPDADILRALYYMFTNPTSSPTTTPVTSNLSALATLAGGVGAPYQPSLSLSSAPTDWSLGITYSSNSTCGTASGGTGGFIDGPTDIAIDSFNNVWFVNSQTGGNLSELASNGAPATCVNLDAGVGSAIAIDSNYGVWVGAGTTMYRYSPGGLSNGNGLSAGILPFPAGAGAPIAATADGLGNVYFTSVAGTVGSLYQLTGAATVGSAVTPLQISGSVGAHPARAMPDYQGCAGSSPCISKPQNIWVTSGTGTISQVTPGTGSGSLNGYITNPINAGINSYGLSLNKGNDVYVSAFDTGAVTRLILSSGSYVTANGWPYTATPAGVAGPTAISVDPRNNVWLPDNTNGSSTGSVSEISSSPNPLSPSTGFQKSLSFLNSSRVLAIDQAGNVWVGGDGNNFITEIVGEAVPVYTPVAAGLKNGRFQSIP
jgi:hypothetical protein